MDPSSTGNVHRNAAIAPSDTAGQEQNPPQSPASRTQPRTLYDLPLHRATILESRDPAARRFAHLCEEAHNKRSSGSITAAQHQEMCYGILEQAEATLNSNDYKAVADDLALQLHDQRGIETQLRLTTNAAANANRGRGNFLHRLQQAPRRMRQLFSPASDVSRMRGANPEHVHDSTRPDPFLAALMAGLPIDEAARISGVTLFGEPAASGVPTPEHRDEN